MEQLQGNKMSPTHLNYEIFIYFLVIEFESITLYMLGKNSPT